MRNTTNFDDAFVTLLAKNAGANPYKCTASVQLSVREGNPRRIFKYLNIYEDRSHGWDNNDVLVCSLLLGQINECPNPCEACALCPLFEVCDFDPEIPDELIAQAETACGM